MGTYEEFASCIYVAHALRVLARGVRQHTAEFPWTRGVLNPSVEIRQRFESPEIVKFCKDVVISMFANVTASWKVKIRNLEKQEAKIKDLEDHVKRLDEACKAHLERIARLRREKGESEEHTKILQNKIDRLKAADEGVSKEQARTILPLNLNTQFIWTGSFLAFIHLCNLRIKPDAQKETRIIVEMMLELVKTIQGNPFQNSLGAFNY